MTLFGCDTKTQFEERWSGSNKATWMSKRASIVAILKNFLSLLAFRKLSFRQSMLKNSLSRLAFQKLSFHPSMGTPNIALIGGNTSVSAS
jgi:hypothetical protein